MSKSTGICWMVVVLALLCGTTSALETACGSVSDDKYATLLESIDLHLSRLLSLRNERHGWLNTPEAMTSLILATPESFTDLQSSISALENEVRTNGTTMTLGKLAQVLTAVKAACKNTTNFGGMNLVTEVENRLRTELRKDGVKSSPSQGWYGVYLAVGAYCISEGRSPGGPYVKRILETQVRHSGSFLGSVDYTAQAMLTLTCITRSLQRHDPVRVKAVHSLYRAGNFLLRSLVTERDNVWVGNTYATPFALLALKENQRMNDRKKICLRILGSLDHRPGNNEPEAAISQALRALKGISVISLMDPERSCPRLDIPSQDQDGNVPGPVSRPSVTEIDITIEIRPNAYLKGPLQHVNVSRFEMNGVKKGTTLYNIMIEANQEGFMAFETKATAWGNSIVSINGRKADSQLKQYWAIEANHESIPVGIDQFIPSHNDTIAFKLITWS